MKPPWDTDSYSSALLDAADKIDTLQKQILYWTDFANKEIEKVEKERDAALAKVAACRCHDWEPSTCSFCAHNGPDTVVGPKVTICKPCAAIALEKVQ